MAEIAKNVIDLAVEAAVSDARKRDAAPELYEALELAAKRFEWLATHNDTLKGYSISPSALRASAAECRAALAKARGEDAP